MVELVFEVMDIAEAGEIVISPDGLDDVLSPANSVRSQPIVTRVCGADGVKTSVQVGPAVTFQ